MTGDASGAPVTLALTDSQFDELVSWLNNTDETAGTLLFRVTEVPGDAALTITVREIRRIAHGHCSERGPDGLTIESTGWMPSLAAADRRGDLFGFAHSHPGSVAEPWPSDRDHEVDRALRAATSIRLTDGRYLSIVIAGTTADPQITGTFHSADRSRSITRVRIAGDRLRLLCVPAAARTQAANRDTASGADASPTGTFDRQIRAFGTDGQALLRDLRVAVVGAGGTGSAVAVLLARLGVGHLILIDPQTLEDTNVPRVHGSTLADIHRPKVDILADHIRSIGFGTYVTKVRGDVLDEITMRSLLHADAVFGCTDDHAGRGRLSRLPNRMTNLLLDIGVLIDAPKGVVLNVFTRLTTVQPGGACLFCTDDLDRALVAAQEMTGTQRRRLAEEGYAPGLSDPDPAVVAFTTHIAATAVTELLDRLIGWGDYDNGTRRPNRIRYRLGIHRPIIETREPVSPSHWCTSRSQAAVGGGEPLLGLAWRERLGARE